MYKRGWTGVFLSGLLVAFVACAGGDDANTTPADDAATDAAAPDTGGAMAEPTQTGGGQFASVQFPDGYTAEDATAGMQIFNNNICMSCHLQNAVGGPLAPPLNDDTWLNIDGSIAAIEELIRTGVPQPVEHPAPMPPMGGAQLTDEQIHQLAAYVYGISHGG